MQTRLNGWKTGAALLCAMAILTSGCAKTTVAGDAGCRSYGEARLSMPQPLGAGPLPEWVADLDDRMTGACT